MCLLQTAAHTCVCATVKHRLHENRNKRKWYVQSYASLIFLIQKPGDQIWKSAKYWGSFVGGNFMMFQFGYLNVMWSILRNHLNTLGYKWGGSFFFHYGKDSSLIWKGMLMKLQHYFKWQEPKLRGESVHCLLWNEKSTRKPNWFPLKNRKHEKAGKRITMNNGNKIKVWGFQLPTYKARNRPFKWGCLLLSPSNRKEHCVPFTTIVNNKTLAEYTEITLKLDLKYAACIFVHTLVWHNQSVRRRSLGVPGS